MSRVERFYLFTTILLAIAAVAGGVTLAVGHSRNPPVDIVLSQTKPPEQTGEIYISGAVANPGIYPLKEGDTIRAVLSDAGVKPDADFTNIHIHVPQESEKHSPQKVDLNRAEPWLLEALPGIGEVTARRIVDYRNENVPFKRIEDLLYVKGIGEDTFEKIRDYVTVSD